MKLFVGRRRGGASALPEGPDAILGPWSLRHEASGPKGQFSSVPDGGVVKAPPFRVSQTISVTNATKRQVSMSRGKRNGVTVSLRCVRSLVVLSLLVASSPVTASLPSEAALRTRVDQLYSALQQGNWRQAEKYLTKESRTTFRAQPKKPVAGYQIDSVQVDASGQSASVVVRIPGPPGSRPGPPVFIPETTRWRLVSGRWYLELSGGHAAPALPAGGPPAQASTPPLSLHSTDLKFQSTWVSVGYVNKGEVKVARFPFTNISQHVVTVGDVQTDCPCVRMTSQQREFKPGEAGALEFQVDPSTFSFKAKMALTLTVTVETEPEHAATLLTIGVALAPAPEKTPPS